MPVDTRRNFLQVVTGGACALAGACTDAPVGPKPFGDVSAGNVTAIPVGTLMQVATLPVFIARDAGGLYAMTSTCTHQGCDVMASQASSSSVSLLCLCHGSQFDRNGGVVRGPASSPLVHFAVEVDVTGTVIVHGDIQVDPAVRVVVA